MTRCGAGWISQRRSGQPGGDSPAVSSERRELEECARIVLKIEQWRLPADLRDFATVNLSMGGGLPSSPRDWP